MDPFNLRIGTGIDVHRFAEDSAPRALWLSGLLWEDSGNGLVGHSDADVVVHAIIDALLSASSLGDIGSFFGVDGEDMAGASGCAMLKTVVDAVHHAGYCIINVSVQLVAIRPRFSARAAEARKVLTETVGAPVSVSATTSDGLGLTGRGEGAAALSNALLYQQR